MSQTPVPITGGAGTSSIAAELVAGTSYQEVEIYGAGGASVLGINPDGSIKASIIGTPSFTMVGNPSISGTVTVAGLQGASVSGSVGIVGTPSISGQVGSSIIGTVPVTQTTNPWIITGSVQASITPAANQSVSGTVGASVIGTVPVVQSGTFITSIASSIPSSVLVGASIFGQLPGGTATIGSVVAIQGTNPYIITGSIQGSFSPSGNQSVSGTVGASIIGIPNPLVITGSVQGSFSPSGNQSVSGTVGASIIGMPNPLVITGSVQGSFSPSGNQSVSGTVGASIIGQLPAGNAVIGAVAASISGTVNVSGSVVGFQGGTQITSVSGGVITSISGGISSVALAGANTVSVVGTLAATQSGAWTTSVVGGPVTLYAPTSSFVSGSPSVITGTASVVLLPTAAGGQRNYVTQVLVTNAAAAGTTVSLIDAGQVVYSGYAAASGGGFSVSFPFPLRQTSTAGSLGVVSSVQASVYVSASGYTAP
jgi:hypothetical protein